MQVPSICIIFEDWRSEQLELKSKPTFFFCMAEGIFLNGLCITDGLYFLIIQELVWRMPLAEELGPTQPSLHVYGQESLHCLDYYRAVRMRQ